MEISGFFDVGLNDRYRLAKVSRKRGREADPRPSACSIARSAANACIIAEYARKPTDDGTAVAVSIDGLRRAISKSCPDKTSFHITVDCGAWCAS